MSNIAGQSSTGPVTPPPIKANRLKKNGTPPRRTVPAAAAPTIDLTAARLDTISKALTAIDDHAYWLGVAEKMIFEELDDIGTNWDTGKFDLGPTYLVMNALSPRVEKIRELYATASLALRLLRGTTEPDPVVAMWPEVLAAEAALGAANDEADEARYDVLANQDSEVASRFADLQPTTTAGVALKLKYIARLNCHHDDKDQLFETRIIRDLVRLFSGDPTWTAASEEE